MSEKYPFGRMIAVLRRQPNDSSEPPLFELIICLLMFSPGMKYPRSRELLINNSGKEAFPPPDRRIKLYVLLQQLSAKQ